MRSRLLPITAALLALAWLIAQACHAIWLAAAVCVTAIPAVALTALARRKGKALTVAAAAIAAVLIALLCPLLLLPSGRWTLVLELAVVAFLAALTPILYAATFPAGSDEP